MPDGHHPCRDDALDSVQYEHDRDYKQAHRGYISLPALPLLAERQTPLQSLEGTIQFNPDLDYWSDNAFTFSFQDQAAFWLLGGTNIALDGGGTLDGSGQAWYDEL